MENKPIYFDHAATTPLCKEALEKMLPYFTEVFGNPKSQKTKNFLNKGFTSYIFVTPSQNCTLSL